MDYDKPIPIPTDETMPFWQAARRGELVLQRCATCGSSRFPPSILCQECNSLEFEWKAVCGRGKIWSFVIFHRAYHPAFKEDLPYAVAYVELEEGPRLITNVVGISHDQIRCDMPVEVFFEDIGGDMRLPKFRPLHRT